MLKKLRKTIRVTFFLFEDCPPSPLCVRWGKHGHRFILHQNSSLDTYRVEFGQKTKKIK